MHDLDAWIGQTNGVNWNFINHLVFVSEHIKNKVLSEIELPSTTKVSLIKHGVNMDKFVFRNKPKGKKIAWINNIAWHKNLVLALQVLIENPEYELHTVGSSLGGWHKAYVDNFVERNNLKFFYQENVENVNDFLQDKDFILLTSSKESFSFITGEAMSIGLKPLIHRFWGAENIWNEKYIWDKISEVKGMLNEDYNPQEYRTYIEQNYPLSKMLAEYDRIIHN